MAFVDVRVALEDWKRADLLVVGACLTANVPEYIVAIDFRPAASGPELEITLDVADEPDPEAQARSMVSGTLDMPILALRVRT